MKLPLDQMHFPVTLRVCLSQPPCFLIANVRIFFSTENKIAQCLSSVLFEKGRYCTWGRHELSVNAVCALGNFLENSPKQTIAFGTIYKLLAVLAGMVCMEHMEHCH